jgi:hypothetical protein
LSAGEKAEAKRWFTMAIDEPQTRAGDIELVSAYGNSGLVVEDPAERSRLFGQERDTLVSLLGPHHVRTLEAMYKSSVFATDPRVAAAQLRDVCERAQRFSPKESSLIPRCAYELGWLAEERGDLVETRAWMVLATDIRKPIADAYLAALDGKLEAAIRDAGAAAAGLQAEWWNKIYAGDSLLFAAICADRLHRNDAAIASLRSALAIYDQLAVIKQSPFYLRRVSRAKALLARLLASSDRAEASKLAGEAAAWYRSAGGYDAIAGELDTIARAP